ncbi:MAG: bifunctional [glutamine synthetase] adenylyltransferase/[glutamine synthetase]-adenylyl-L-tyrosine phosphorylase [Pararhizobium sp.]
MNQIAKEAAQTDDSRLLSLKISPVAPLSSEEADGILADLLRAAGVGSRLAAILKKRSPARDFLGAALSLSPYLRDAALADPPLVARALSMPLEEEIAALVWAARDAWRNDEGTPAPEAAVMANLRRIKRETSFLIALADLAGVFSAAESARHLSALAGASLQAAVDHLLLAAHEAGKLRISDPDKPSKGSGLIVLAMGKLGAEELNYSSDIDIVLFYDPAARIVEPMEATETFARLARRLVRIMQERTADGYVFRTDLRLRPDPGSTPLAIPVEAALNYYEGRGQNWERAAFIKARPVAGDIEAGEAFCRELVPFVFRKYLDYAAIADIHSIKRQIHAHKGHGEIAVKGHNVKLGRGGIREIEFFVQTQQLIAGGRMSSLRARRTDAALDGLASAHWISPDTASELKADYWYLRDVEHRIQMVRDEQSHTLPESDEELRRIALMMGEPDAEAFSVRLVRTLRSVEHHYAELFEKEARLSTATGNLVFTGEGDDPGTIETLKALGFSRPSDIAHVIRTWHYGRYRSTRSVEARERLTELTPSLLQAFGATRRADEALLRFDAFISGLPAGIQLFSLLGNNPGLLSLIVTIMSAAPRLADIIARKPHVFDGMLDPTLLAELPTRAYLADRLAAFLDRQLAYEEVLDRLRILADEQKFLIGVRLLTGAISGARAGEALSDLADLIVEAALGAVASEMERAHGKVRGGRAAVIGMGKLGSRELTAGSDIDIILLYDHEAGFAESDGLKPLDPVRYYTRLTQRLIAALSAPTAEGVLYEVDLRLRPSGNKGPVATSLASFRKYQREEAWTWEQMALSRARVVAGDESLGAAAAAEIAEILRRPRDEAKVATDVREMRATIEEEKPPRDPWDLKLVPGGLIDIEFVAQYLALVAGGTAGRADTATIATLKALGAGRLPPEALATLTEALALYSEITQLLRLCLEGPFDPKDAPAGLLDLLCRTLDFPDIGSLEAHLAATGRTVRTVFNESVGKRNGRLKG